MGDGVGLVVVVFGCDQCFWLWFLVMVVVFGCFWLGSSVLFCGFLNGFAPMGFKSAV